MEVMLRAQHLEGGDSQGPNHRSKQIGRLSLSCHSICWLMGAGQNHGEHRLKGIGASGIQRGMLVIELSQGERWWRIIVTICVVSASHKFN
jgi:hypothetical protein